MTWNTDEPDPALCCEVQHGHPRSFVEAPGVGKRRSAATRRRTGPLGVARSRKGRCHRKRSGLLGAQQQSADPPLRHGSYATFAIARAVDHRLVRGAKRSPRRHDSFRRVMQSRTLAKRPPQNRPQDNNPPESCLRQSAILHAAMSALLAAAHAVPLTHGGVAGFVRRQLPEGQRWTSKS